MAQRKDQTLSHGGSSLAGHPGDTQNATPKPKRSAARRSRAKKLASSHPAQACPGPDGGKSLEEGYLNRAKVGAPTELSGSASRREAPGNKSAAPLAALWA